MQKITLPQFQKALAQVWPASYKMVLAWAESGDLPCFRNPRAPKDQAHYWVKPYCVEQFCRDVLQMTPGEVEAVLRGLGLSDARRGQLW